MEFRVEGYVVRTLPEEDERGFMAIEVEDSKYPLYALKLYKGDKGVRAQRLCLSPQLMDALPAECLRPRNKVLMEFSGQCWEREIEAKRQQQGFGKLTPEEEEKRKFEVGRIHYEIEHFKQVTQPTHHSEPAPKNK